MEQKAPEPRQRRGQTYRSPHIPEGSLPKVEMKHFPVTPRGKETTYALEWMLRREGKKHMPLASTAYDNSANSGWPRAGVGIASGAASTTRTHTHT